MMSMKSVVGLCRTSAHLAGYLTLLYGINRCWLYYWTALVNYGTDLVSSVLKYWWKPALTRVYSRIAYHWTNRFGNGWNSQMAVKVHIASLIAATHTVPNFEEQQRIQLYHICHSWYAYACSRFHNVVLSCNLLELEAYCTNAHISAHLLIVWPDANGAKIYWRNHFTTMYELSTHTHHPIRYCMYSIANFCCHMVKCIEQLTFFVVDFLRWWSIFLWIMKINVIYFIFLFYLDYYFVISIDFVMIR